MKDLRQLLEKLEVGPVQCADNLAMFPLLDNHVATSGYRLLDEAIRGGEVRIREVSEEGSVPHLLLENDSGQPVLLLDGEELIGCKQNRVINLTLLAPPGKTLTIPVSCVEQGRWSARSEAFMTSDRAQYASGRARKVSQVSRALEDRGEYKADQRAIWDHLARKQARMRSHSPTGAMADLFEQRADRLARYRRGLQAVEGQIGGVFAINGRVVGLELFDAPSTFRRSLPKLVNSYALDALDYHTPLFPAPDRGDAEAFLEILRDTAITRYPALGLGEDLRLAGRNLEGAALVHQERLVHLVAFDTGIDASRGDRRTPRAGAWPRRPRRRRH